MKARGELNGDDPWGAMNAPAQVAAGGSGSSKPQSNQAIALGIPQSAPQRRAQANRYDTDSPPHPASLGDEDDGEETVSRPSSPDQPPTLTRSKGKGRAGKPEETYTSRYGAAAPADAGSDDDAPASSSEEDEGRPPKTYAPKNHDNSDESDDDDDDNTRPPRGRTPARRGRSPGNTHLRPRSTSSNYSRGEDSGEDHDEDGIPDCSAPPPGGPPAAAKGKGFFISAEDRTRYCIPAELEMTQERFEAMKRRRAAEGRLAMTQHSTGGLDEE